MSSVSSFQTLIAAVKTAKAAIVSQPYLAAIYLVVVIYLTHSYFVYARLRHFPGPKLARWTRIPFILWHTSSQVHLKFQDVSETYGIVPHLPQKLRWLESPASSQIG